MPKNKLLSIEDYKVTMVVPLHSDIEEVQRKATVDNGISMPYLDQSKFAKYQIAKSLKSVKKGDVELAGTFDQVLTFLDGLPQNYYNLLNVAYDRLMDITEEIKKLKD